MKRILWMVLLLFLITGTSQGQKKKERETPLSPQETVIALTNETDSINFLVGTLLGYLSTHHVQGLDEIFNPEVFTSAFKSVISGDNKLEDEEELELFSGVFLNWQERVLGRNREEGERLLAENAKRPEIKVTESGLQYEVIRKGEDEGIKPGLFDEVVISFQVKGMDGEIFSEEEETEWMPGYFSETMGEALLMMSPGAKYVFYVPWEKEYFVPFTPVLVFEVEMHSITEDEGADGFEVYEIEIESEEEEG